MDACSNNNIYGEMECRIQQRSPLLRKRKWTYLKENYGDYYEEGVEYDALKEEVAYFKCILSEYNWKIEPNRIEFERIQMPRSTSFEERKEVRRCFHFFLDNISLADIRIKLIIKK